MSDPRIVGALASACCLTWLTLGLHWAMERFDLDIVQVGLMCLPASVVGLLVLLRRAKPEVE